MPIISKSAALRAAAIAARSQAPGQPGGTASVPHPKRGVALPVAGPFATLASGRTAGPDPSAARRPRASMSTAQTRLSEACDGIIATSDTYAEAFHPQARRPLRKPLRAARLELRRALSAISHRTSCRPSKPRGSTSGALRMPAGPGADGRDGQAHGRPAQRMHAMLSVGALTHRERHWVGSADADKPTLLYHAPTKVSDEPFKELGHTPDEVEDADGNIVSMKTLHYGVSQNEPSRSRELSVMAHEVRHGVQNNGPGQADLEKFVHRAAGPAAGHSPIAGSLTASASLPSLIVVAPRELERAGAVRLDRGAAPAIRFWILGATTRRLIRPRVGPLTS